MNNKNLTRLDKFLASEVRRIHQNRFTVETLRERDVHRKENASKRKERDVRVKGYVESHRELLELPYATILEFLAMAKRVQDGIVVKPSREIINFPQPMPRGVYPFNVGVYLRRRLYMKHRSSVYKVTPEDAEAETHRRQARSLRDKLARKYLKDNPSVCLDTFPVELDDIPEGTSYLAIKYELARRDKAKKIRQLVKQYAQEQKVGT